MNKRFIILVAMIVVFCTSCGGGVQYRDPSKAGGTREWGPKEVEDTTKAVADSIYTFLKNDWQGPAIIRMVDIENKSSQHVQKKMLSESIVSSLVQKKIAIEEDDFIKQTLEEIGKAQAGLTDENYSIPVGKLRSPNFVLAGRIDDNVQYEGGKEMQYIVVTFKLTNLETGQRAWTDQKKFYKVAKTKSFSW